MLFDFHKNQKIHHRAHRNVVLAVKSTYRIRQINLKISWLHILRSDFFTKTIIIIRKNNTTGVMFFTRNGLCSGWVRDLDNYHLPAINLFYNKPNLGNLSK